MDQTNCLPEEQPKLGPAPGRPGMELRKRKRKELDPGFPKSCEVCNIVLNRKFEYDAHVGGKRHMKELRRKDVQEQLEKEHIEQAKAVPTSGTKEDIIVMDPKTSLRMCTVCSLGLQSPMVELAHIVGKKHKLKLKKFLNRLLSNPPKKGFVGRCEVCKVSYTSKAMMIAHLNGKRHRKNCGNQGQDEAGVPTQSGDQPFLKKIKLQPVITPSLAQKLAEKAKAHELLEKQAEEAYEKYKSVATTIPLEEAQELYTKYQRIYRAYEAAYQEHMMSKEETK